MYRDKKIIIVTPAGRKRYLSILKRYVLSCKFVDQWQIWQNTTINEDIEYFHELAKENEKVVVETRDFQYHYYNERHIINCENIFRFFDKCVEKDHVYLRFDDDIVWMHPKAIQNILDFRIDNPQYFLVYGNIINNAICDHLHQRVGVLNLQHYVEMPLGYHYWDEQGWHNPYLAEKKHRCLFEKIKSTQTHKYYFNRWILNGYERVSINVICWLGEEFAKFEGKVGWSEEHWLAVEKPMSIGMPNCICGNSLFGHFSFFPQRPYLDTTDILEKYAQLANQVNEDYHHFTTKNLSLL